MTVVLRRLIALYAPFLPFVTDELYATLYGPREGVASIHLARWPNTDDDLQRPEEVDLVLAVLRTSRALRTQRRIPQSQEVDTLVVDCAGDLDATLRKLENSLLAASRARTITYGDADRATGHQGVSIDLVHAGKDAGGNQP